MINKFEDSDVAENPAENTQEELKELNAFLTGRKNESII